MATTEKGEKRGPEIRLDNGSLYIWGLPINPVRLYDSKLSMLNILKDNFIAQPSCLELLIHLDSAAWEKISKGQARSLALPYHWVRAMITLYTRSYKDSWHN